MGHNKNNKLGHIMRLRTNKTEKRAKGWAFAQKSFFLGHHLRLHLHNFFCFHLVCKCISWILFPPNQSRPLEGF
jgi:hypothetical protein